MGGLEGTVNAESDEERIGTKIAELRDRVLKGATFRDIRADILALDQSDPSRKTAPLLLAFLREPGIAKKLTVGPPEEVRAYYATVSFIAFHTAQILASANKYGEAGEHTKLSLDAYEQGYTEEQKRESADSWKAYVEGTQLYFSGKTIPDSVIARVKDEGNRAILLRLNAGLRKRGAPNYAEDYYSAPAQ
ncbi:MAG: hypothetical protein AAB955_03485 [Patescibacteria group bacterium]